MKKILSFFCVSVFLLSLFAVYAKGLDCCDLSAECAVVMCVQTGQVLLNKNGDKRCSMASTTKIMTSLIALEQHTPGRIITADKKSISVEGTSMGLQAGDKVSLKSLVYGMLLLSGNDGANLTATAVAGSAEKFSDMMNKRAQQIGMKNTHFVTPSGLDDDMHYTTAYDMALLGCEAVKNPEFLEVCSGKKAVVSYGNPPYDRTLYNHNKMLSLYDGCLGIKTGFTRKSGRCLVTCAERNGVMLVAVTLKAPDDWNDHKIMLDYGFEAVRSSNQKESNISVAVTGGLKSFVKAESGSITVCTDKTEKKIFIEKFLYAPVHKGDVIGEVKYFCDGKVIASSPVTACENIQAVTAKTEEKHIGFFDKIKNIFRRT